MKKFLAIIAAAVLSAAAVYAQPRNVGGYLGLVSQGAFYQHSITDTQFIQVEAGTATFAFHASWGFHSAVSYNFILVSKGEGFFNFFLGPGLDFTREPGVYAAVSKNGLGKEIKPRFDIYNKLGVQTKIGVELNFSEHFTLSVSHNPVLGFGFGSRTLNSSDVDDPAKFPGKAEGDKVTAWGFLDAINLYQVMPTIGLSYRF